MIYLTILVTIFSTPPVLVRADLPPGLAGDSWGQEYCRQGLCAIMPSDRWRWCCDHYYRCCAYVEYTMPQDPFYFEKYEDRNHHPSPRPQKPTPSVQEPPASVQEPPASVQEPPANVQQFPAAADQSSRSSQLQEGPALVVQADQLQPEPQPQPQPPSFSQTKPGLDAAQTQPRPQQQPPRSYNEVLKRGDAKMCRAKFCGLLTQRKHRRCCDLYGQCCAYANLHYRNDPFYYEKHPRNV